MRLLVCLVALAAFVAAPALAVDTEAFELDGDAVDNGADPKEDWQLLALGGGTAIAQTAVPIADPAPVSIFTTGGSKDVRDISQWKHKNGSVPDKDDLTNAYAAAYEIDGDLVIYFGADRFSNDGDAQMGFWFFQNEITLGSNDFNGVHAIGDLLVLVNFEGGGTMPNIEVLEWVGSGGDVSGTLQTLVPAGAAVCDGLPGDTVCAITNPGTATANGEVAPWAYVPKPNVGVPGFFPAQTLFEGGINISELLGEERCFTSFLAETRSSSSPTAQLKDFVLGAFPVCRVELSKICTADGVLKSVCEQDSSVECTGDADCSGVGGSCLLDVIVADYQVSIVNEGFGSIGTVELSDDACTETIASDDFTESIGPIGVGETATVDVRCVITEDDQTAEPDVLSPLENGVSAVADGGDIEVINGTCSRTDGDVCFASCNVEFTPMIDVTKACETRLEVVDGLVAVAVDFSGDVCNTSDQTPSPAKLSNVQVSDDKAGGPLTLTDCEGGTLGTSTDLRPGECACYEDSYFPASTNSTCPEEALFMDTVTASGEETFQGQTVEAMATADCELCPGDCP